MGTILHVADDHVIKPSDMRVPARRSGLSVVKASARGRDSLLARFAPILALGSEAAMLGVINFGREISGGKPSLDGARP